MQTLLDAIACKAGVADTDQTDVAAYQLRSSMMTTVPGLVRRLSPSVACTVLILQSLCCTALRVVPTVSS